MGFKQKDKAEIFFSLKPHAIETKEESDCKKLTTKLTNKLT